MRQPVPQQTLGQIFYELEASRDTSANYWCEWRELSAAQQQRCEEVAQKIVAQLQAKPEDHEEG
jgi:hypothetical protein